MPESRPMRLSASRSPVSTPRAGPSTLGDRLGLDLGSLVNQRLEADAELGEHRGRDLEAADDSRLLREHDGLAGRVLVDERERRHVTGADVLRKPRARVGERQCHRSNVTSSPAPTTLCAAKRSSSNGKSARK